MNLSSIELLRAGFDDTSAGDLPLMEAIRKTIEGVRRELPLGSVLSPLVARAFVGRELRAALGDKKVVRLSYVDDFAIGACSPSTAKAGFQLLRKRLQSLPAGPIYLHVDKSADADEDPIRVLGYKLTTHNGYKGNPVHVVPGRKRFDRFHRRALTEWVAAGSPDDLEAFSAELLDRWIPTQQAWTKVPVNSRDVALTSVVSYLGDFSMLLCLYCKKNNLNIDDASYRLFLSLFLHKSV